MADINIDTTGAQYQQLLAGLGTLRTVLAPRIRLLRRMTGPQQRQWLQRDPLLRRTLIMARTVSGIIDEELAE